MPGLPAGAGGALGCSAAAESGAAAGAGSGHEADSGSAKAGRSSGWLLGLARGAGLTTGRESGVQLTDIASTGDLEVDIVPLEICVIGVQYKHIRYVKHNSRSYRKAEAQFA